MSLPSVTYGVDLIFWTSITFFLTVAILGPTLLPGIPSLVATVILKTQITLSIALPKISNEDFLKMQSEKIKL